jgi:hypothetical protein
MAGFEVITEARADASPNRKGLNLFRRRVSKVASQIQSAFYDKASSCRCGSLFVQLLCKHRLMRQLCSELEHLSLNELLQGGQGSWHGVKLGKPDWNFNSHSLARCVVCHSELSRFMSFSTPIGSRWNSSCTSSAMPMVTGIDGSTRASHRMTTLWSGAQRH